MKQFDVGDELVLRVQYSSLDSHDFELPLSEYQIASKGLFK